MSLREWATEDATTTADDEDDDDDVADWDEPTGPEEAPDGITVEPVANYLAQLMQRKYGDDWELLLSDVDEDLYGEEDGDEEDEAIDTEAKPASASGYVDEVAHGTEDGEDDEAGSEELRRLVSQQQAAGGDAEEDEEEDEDAAEAAEAEAEEEELALISSMAATTPEKMAEALSPSLADFLLAQRDGTIHVPEPFPKSEWEQVYLTALTDPMRYSELSMTWANLRVCLSANFADLSVGEDPAAEPDAIGSALRKARRLHAATGLPALAETTCCHVAGLSTKPPSETQYIMGDSVMELILRMRPGSPPERECVFTSAGAYVDGETTIIGQGVCNMPLAVAEARHATIATSTALDDLFVKVAEEKGLKFVGTDAFDDFYELQQLKKGGKLQRNTGGSSLLKQRIMREAEVLDASILKVSSFINHMVDVELMEACGEELAERLEETQATKVLTVEATGLLPGMFVGKALQLPVVFARKSRQIGVSDSYQTSFKSSTKASVQDLYVSTEVRILLFVCWCVSALRFFLTLLACLVCVCAQYLNPGDRVIIIDDFLAGGTTADALIRLCRMAGAIVVGGGFLIEKLTDAGRAFLSGYQVPLESLALVDIKENGAIQIVEEEESPSEIQAQQAELDRLLAREEPFDAIAAEAAVEAALKGAAEEDDEEHEEEEE